MSRALDTKSSRSCPQNNCPPTSKLGAPQRPRVTARVVASLRASLTCGLAIFWSQSAGQLDACSSSSRTISDEMSFPSAQKALKMHAISAGADSGLSFSATKVRRSGLTVFKGKMEG